MQRILQASLKLSLQDHVEQAAEVTLSAWMCPGCGGSLLVILAPRLKRLHLWMLTVVEGSRASVGREEAAPKDDAPGRLALHEVELAGRVSCRRPNTPRTSRQLIRRCQGLAAWNA